VVLAAGVALAQLSPVSLNFANHSDDSQTVLSRIQAQVPRIIVGTKSC
jgi:hypothetical protein